MLKGKSPLLVALVLGLLAGVVAYSAIKKKEYDVRVGWKGRQQRRGAARERGATDR